MDDDSLFLFDEEVPEADELAADIKSRPIDRSFSANRGLRSWRDKRGGITSRNMRNNSRGKNHSIYGKSCPAAPVVGSLPTPSHVEDNIPALELPPNSHQEMSFMLSQSVETEQNSNSGTDNSNEEPRVRFLHFEQKRMRKKNRNVFSDMASSCPAQLRSNFMGGRLSIALAENKSKDMHVSEKSITENCNASARPSAVRQTGYLSGRTKLDHSFEKISQGGEEPDTTILSSSQTAMSMLQQYAMSNDQSRLAGVTR